MTNKEAITYLEWLSNIDFSKKYPTYPMVTKPEQVEALEMAITALENAKNDNLTPESAQNVQKQALKMQKSDALGAKTGETCSDTISRQAAIDALYKMLHDCFWADDEELDAVITTLNDLPSVQPERTCVNCGRTVNNGGWYADGGTRCPIEEHYALPKDGYCHLWEKRNVTDDDYPERRTDE